MITKAQIKFVHSLRDSSSREKEGLFVVEGVKMVDELLNSSSAKVVEIYATSKWDSPFASIHNVTLVQEWELEKMSSLTTPNKVLALVEIPESINNFSSDLSSELVLVLDRISDPGNMGTIIRTAEWFGIDRIFASSDSVDFYNQKVVQASMGSIFRMALNKGIVLELFKNYTGKMPIYGTLLEGEGLGEVDLTSSGLIVIGNESHGIAEELKRFIDRRITITASHSSMSESLNASVATAIVCYEFRRQNPKQ